MANGPTTKVKDRGFNHIVRQLRIAEDARVSVGVRGTKKHKRSDASLVDVAVYNEFGVNDKETGEVIIPARPFISGNHDEKRAKYKKELKERFMDVLRGSTVIAELEQFGERVVGDVKLYMTKLSTPPNAPSTKAHKKGVDNPLIDTGTLRNAITKKVEV